MFEIDGCLRYGEMFQNTKIFQFITIVIIQPASVLTEVIPVLESTKIIKLGSFMFHYHIKKKNTIPQALLPLHCKNEKIINK